MKTIPLVVVGTSSGGLAALIKLLAQLGEGFPAAVFVVRHMSADSTTEPVIHALRKCTKLKCVEARPDQAFERRHVYLAPPDHHMMVGKTKIMITKGAQENRSRPAIDPLFRSAAVAHGNAVIGLLLTGNLDDGSAGLLAIQRCGGTCVVQDPADAAYPDMPRNAIARVKIDHCLPLAEMGSLLTLLVQRKLGKSPPVPQDIAVEARIAERVLSDLASVESLGAQVPFNCPGCGGVLWEMAKGKSLRYRCHTGHSFTAPVLLAEQTKKVEETLWVALRMFEERRNLLLTMAAKDGIRSSVRSATERAKDAELHIQRIREMLTSGEQARNRRDAEGSFNRAARS